VREIKAGADEAAIRQRLKDQFDDKGGSIDRDVTALIADLRAKGLLEG
jgi:hypothetical protein